MASVIIFIIFTNLTPLIPLSFVRRGGGDFLKGFHPFKLPTFTVITSATWQSSDISRDCFGADAPRNDKREVMVDIALVLLYNLVRRGEK